MAEPELFLAPWPEEQPKPDDVPELPADAALPDLTPLFEDGLEEVGRIENGVTIRPEALPLLYTFQATGLREPSISTESEFEIARITVCCQHNQGFVAHIGIPTATLLELLERAAAQHPLWSLTLLSHLYTVRELFKVK